jgi:hypothetical protein
VAKRRAAVEASEDDLDELRAELSALSTLMFATAHGHPAFATARELDRQLVPVRERARAAVQHRPTLEEARAALGECWALVDDAGRVIDCARWLLNAGGTGGWAQRHVDYIVRRRRTV